MNEEEYCVPNHLCRLAQKSAVRLPFLCTMIGLALLNFPLGPPFSDSSEDSPLVDCNILSSEHLLLHSGYISILFSLGVILSSDCEHPCCDPLCVQVTVLISGMILYPHFQFLGIGARLNPHQVKTCKETSITNLQRHLVLLYCTYLSITSSVELTVN